MSFKLFIAALLIAISTACENVYDKLALSAADLDITVSLVDTVDSFDPTCDLEITITSELWQKLLLYFPDGGIPVLSSDKALTFQVGKKYQVSFKISDARRRLQTAEGVTITAVQELDSNGQTTGQYSYVINAYVDTYSPLDWAPMDTDLTAPASLVNFADIGANPQDINISLCTTVDWTKQYVFAVASDLSKLGDGIEVNLELVDCPKTTTSWNVGELRYDVDLGYYALKSTCLYHGYSLDLGCCTNAYTASSDVEECECLQAGTTYTWVTGSCPDITTNTPITTDSCPPCDPSVIGSCTAATASGGSAYACWDDVCEGECCGEWYTWVQDGACPVGTTPQPDPVTTDGCPCVSPYTYGQCVFEDGTCSDSWSECECCKHSGTFTADSACPIDTTATPDTTPQPDPVTTNGCPCSGTSYMYDGQCVFDDGTCSDLSECACCEHSGTFTADSACPIDTTATPDTTSQPDPVTTDACPCVNPSTYGECQWDDGTCSDSLSECECCKHSGTFTASSYCPMDTPDTTPQPDPVTTDSCPPCDPSVIGSCTAATASGGSTDCWVDVYECECCGEWYTWVQDGACPMDTTPQPDPVTTDGCPCSGTSNTYGQCVFDDGTCSDVSECACCKHSGTFTADSACPIDTTATPDTTPQPDPVTTDAAQVDTTADKTAEPTEKTVTAEPAKTTEEHIKPTENADATTEPTEEERTKPTDEADKTAQPTEEAETTEERTKPTEDADATAEPTEEAKTTDERTKPTEDADATAEPTKDTDAEQTKDADATAEPTEDTDATAEPTEKAETTEEHTKQTEEADTTAEPTDDGGSDPTISVTEDCEDSQWEDWDGPCEEDPGNGCGLYLDFDVNVCILDSWIIHRIFTYSAKEAFVSIVDIDGTDLVCDVDSAYITALLVTYHPGSNVAGSLRRLQNIQTTDIQSTDIQTTDDDDDKCPVVNDLCGDENNFVPRYRVHVQLSLRCSGDYSDECDKLSAVALSLQRKDDDGSLNDEYEVSIESASKNNDKSCGIGLGRARLNGYATMTLKNPSGETVLVTTIDISSNASERNWFGVVMSVLVVLAFLK